VSFRPVERRGYRPPVEVEPNTSQGSALFSVGDDVYRWDDVVRLARVRGDWDAITREVEQGLGALDELGEPDPDEVQALAREFRYTRGLLAADELTQWLERRRLTNADWHGYLERSLAREAFPDAAGRTAPDDAALWAEGICSGRLEELARTLARLVAVSPHAPFEELERALEAFSDEAAADEGALAREIELNRLEWLRVTFAELELPNEDAAREAAMLVSTDHFAFEDVAVQAGVGLVEREEWLADLDGEVGTRLLGARPGDLVGPTPRADAFVLMLVRAKIAPVIEEPAVREKAAESVVRRAVARRTDEQVRWLEHL